MPSVDAVVRVRTTAEVAVTPAVDRPLRNTPPTCRSCTADTVSPSALEAEDPTMNSWPTRCASVRPAIGSAVGVEEGVVVAGGEVVADRLGVPGAPVPQAVISTVTAAATIAAFARRRIGGDGRGIIISSLPPGSVMVRSAEWAG